MSDFLDEYIENSFLKPLLSDRNITDISYNGSDIFYMHNFLGRQKANIKISNEEALSFLRQIANINNVGFSIKNPILDISFKKFRLNATYYTISSKEKRGCVTFSLRIFQNELLIKNDDTFFDKRLNNLFLLFLKLRFSFLIAGLPSSGKSEFQKYLITLFSNNERILIIDTINELDIEYKENCDATIFVADEFKNIHIYDLLKLSLRYNPDYLMIAEARGSEFEMILTSALSGIGTITTLHARESKEIITRAINMVEINNKNLDHGSIEKNLINYFNVLIYIEKTIDSNGNISRRVKSLDFYYDSKLYNIYSYSKELRSFKKLPEQFVKEFKEEIATSNIDEVFL